MNLIAEVDGFESKRRVDDALNVVIERAGTEVYLLVLCGFDSWLKVRADGSDSSFHHKTATSTLSVQERL